MLTTRTWAVQILTEKCGDRISYLVEILGFKKEDVLKYILHAFTDSADAEKLSTEFLRYLHSHPQLESIMYISH